MPIVTERTAGGCQDWSQRGLGSATLGLKYAGIWRPSARDCKQQTHELRDPCLPQDVLRMSVSGDPSAILVMEPTEDRSRNDVLGRDPSHGRQPTRADRWLHAKTTMGSAMIVANIFLQHVIGVDIVDDDDVVEAIAA